jgi:hypothetical protein
MGRWYVQSTVIHKHREEYEGESKDFTLYRTEKVAAGVGTLLQGIVGAKARTDMAPNSESRGQPRQVQCILLC